MPIVSQSEFRANIAKLLDQVEADSKELYIHRQGKEAMVVMPLSTFESWKETEHLMSDPANRAHIKAGIAELDRGEGVAVTVEQLREMIGDSTDSAA